MSQPSTQDLNASFDPTSYGTITGAQLLQLITGAYPHVGNGLFISTDDTAGVPNVPDAITNTKWQKYLWRRQTATSVGIYVWDDNAASDVTYLKWVSINIAGIGVGTIVNNMIADNTITDSKIANLNYSKLIGAPTGLAPSGAAGGSLNGNYPNPSLANNAVGTSNITDGAITGGKLEAGSQTTGVGYDKLKCNASFQDMLRTNAAANAMEFFTPSALVKSTAPSLAGNAYKYPRVKSDASDFEMVLPDIYQKKVQVLTTTDSTTSAIPIDTSIPQNTEGKEFTTLAITTKSASSILHVHFEAVVATSAAGAVILALFQDSVADALKTVGISTGVAFYGMLSLDYYVASPGLGSTITFKIRYGQAGGITAYMNRNVAALFGASSNTYFLIEEVTGTIS